MTWWMWAVIGAVAAPGLGYLAGRRALRQPIEVAVEAEAEVLGLVLAEPDRFFQICILEPRHFAWAPHRRIFATIRSHAVPSEDPERIAEAVTTGVVALDLPYDAAGLRAILAAELSAEDLALADSLGEVLVRSEGMAAKVCTGAEAALDAGGEVLACGEDRDGFAGALVMVPDEEGGRERPLRRQAPRFGVFAALGYALLGAATCGVASLLTDSGWGQGAVVVLVLGCLLLSVVDIYTMYIDYPSLAVLAGLSWALAVPCAFQRGGLGAVLVPIIVTAVLVIGIEGIAFVHSRIRRTMTLGGGDSVLLLVTLSVPLLVSGSPMVAVWGFFAATILALVLRLVMIGAGKATMQTPFAFGPYLAAGWLAGWMLAKAAS